MDIRSATQSIPTATTIEGASRPGASAAGQLAQEVERVKRVSTAPREIVDAVVPAAEIDVPEPLFVRADLSVDKAARRVHVRLFDQESGQLVREYPSEEQLRYLQVTREQLGKLLKEEA
jgi:uncharacterized FlaG/YvyC family protein